MRRRRGAPDADVHFVHTALEHVEYEDVRTSVLTHALYTPSPVFDTHFNPDTHRRWHAAIPRASSPPRTPRPHELAGRPRVARSTGLSDAFERGARERRAGARSLPVEGRAMALRKETTARCKKLCAFLPFLMLLHLAHRSSLSASSLSIFPMRVTVRDAPTNPRAVVWTTDLHASPIGCQISMFSALNVDVVAKIDFPNCVHFKGSRRKNLCSTDKRGLRRGGRNFGYSLDPQPNITLARLYDHYAQDPDFRRSDVVFCSHPAANCEIYIPFQKPILIYNSLRLEFGRNDEFVWWRKPIISEDRVSRWERWVSNLQAIANSSTNVIAANNMYDAVYMEYFTGVKTQYIPSWCGDHPEQMQKHSYQANKREIVLTPYRVNLEYSREVIPDNGWPHPSSKTNKNPLDHAIFDDLKNIRTDFKLVSMKQAFPRKGKFKSIHDFKRFRAVVLIPYQSSTMFFFELYRANVPMLVPSRALLTRWVSEHKILWEVSYGNPERLNHTLHSDLPNPNSFDAVSRSRWMEFYDVYREDVFPYILYFDSWEHAAEIVESVDLSSVSAKMSRHNVEEYSRIKDEWRHVFERLSV